MTMRSMWLFLHALACCMRVAGRQHEGDNSQGLTTLRCSISAPSFIRRLAQARCPASAAMQKLAQDLGVAVEIKGCRAVYQPFAQGFLNKGKGFTIACCQQERWISTMV